MKKILAIVSLLALVPISHASSQQGTVQDLLVRASDGLTYVILTGDRVGQKPACATKSYWMIKDENSEVGKKQYAALLAAQLAGTEVTIFGMSSCSRWGDGQDIDLVRLRN